MGKEIWKPGNMVYPLPAVMVTCRNKDGRDNIITVAWTGTLCTNPALVYVSIRPERYSYSIIRDTKEFAINLTTQELAWATDFCGVKSGKEIEKFKETGLKKEEASSINVSLIKESPVNIECRVKDIIPLGSHDMFIAEVLNVHADEAFMDVKGKFHLDLAKPIVYSHGQYYCIGEKLGKFGYSVKKNKTRKTRS